MPQTETQGLWEFFQPALAAWRGRGRAGSPPCFLLQTPPPTCRSMSPVEVLTALTVQHSGLHDTAKSVGPAVFPPKCTPSCCNAGSGDHLPPLCTEVSPIFPGPFSRVLCDAPIPRELTRSNEGCPAREFGCSLSCTGHFWVTRSAIRTQYA